MKEMRKKVFWIELKNKNDEKEQDGWIWDNDNNAIEK
jgi:hypothetical protein